MVGKAILARGLRKPPVTARRLQNFLFAASLCLCASAGSAADATASSAAPKMQFPEGTATASEVCGACHQAVYHEMSAGAAADLKWGAMKLQPKSQSLLVMPATGARAAAHFIAGIDPWPIEAARVEEDGRKCNVCHYPQPLAYPDMHSAKIDPPKPRESNHERGVTCASCHLTPDGKIRGPYEVDAPHETLAEPRIQTSVACAYCHASGPRVVGKQTQTFLEWREDFFKPGLGRQHCQDCHMPKTVRKLAEGLDLPMRTAARHLFTGGHSLQRVSSALNLSAAQGEGAKPEIILQVTNVGAGHSVPTGSNRRGIYLKADLITAKGKIAATKEWLFAPWFGNRPDDRSFLEEDSKGPDPIATMQADAQGPHEPPVRAGEQRVLAWNPDVAAGTYTLVAVLIYDLNRYNDRQFKDDQQEIARLKQPLKIALPAK